MKVYEGKLSGKGKKFGVVLSRFNHFIGERLLEGVTDCLLRHEVDSNSIEVFKVPGAFEIPAVAARLAKTKRFDAIICIGAVIRGDTPHFDYIASQVSKGILEASISSEIPVIFGIITADTIEQAIERAGTKQGNKGFDAAMSALEMADLTGVIKSG
jgi:6,7-dimethyl-8-ribityllumazine synthase